MNDVELIRLIQIYPILYDKDSARSAKNAASKDAAWKTISMKLGASERACITRWKSIRDRFGKEFRRFQEDPDSPTYWDMFPHLLFLKDHYKHGLVKHESLDGMKFMPSRRKPRRSRLEDRDKRPRDEEFEEEREDIELCQQLIQLVKQHPVLYDRHEIRNSKNLSAKNEAWRAISESLNVSEQLIYNRWKKLRDRFAREYRNHQINQAAPITWRYFNDLLFLGRHFRKGIPLIIANIKKRGRPPKCLAANRSDSSTMTSNEQIWSADSPFSSDNEADELEDEIQYEYQDQDQDGEDFDDYVQMEEEDEEEEEQLMQPIEHEQQLDVSTTMDESELEQTSTANSSAAAAALIENVIEETDSISAEKLMDTVISNMETVLQQSKDCLHVLQQPTQTKNSLLNKVQMLLDGLNPEQRKLAERKILHFLCECQIKTLDGVEIEDVAPCHILN
ncbi:uncharacterized protein LOC6562907 [Drosophila grimshawi]|uniref:uncharacterized protein LOC6562907 n=1 Tax=Drosophila grimshawi TaxID=7222 RepID=UPI000C86EFBF|nr:uncharacterized protein LOC6562907 [Drosophila grimshawi]